MKLNHQNKKTVKIIIAVCIAILLISAALTYTLVATGVVGGSHITQIEKSDYDAEFIEAENKKNPPQTVNNEVENSGTGSDAEENHKKIVVLDPGHGVSSQDMTNEQKAAEGWVYNQEKGEWGEWRHFKSGTMWQDCMGSGCSGRVPKGGSCWYRIGSGDRDFEPEINLKNVVAAKKYLEQMGYEVRITRTEADNPSMTKRLKFCYPNGDTQSSPDADLFVCIHSNAGGGRGSYYIALSGVYDQAGIPSDYIERGNRAGKCINDRIVSETELSAASGGRYDGYPELVLFCKSPIPIAYLEVGFFDNASDLAILQKNSDAIGKAIAEGIDDYFKS